MRLGWRPAGRLGMAEGNRQENAPAGCAESAPEFRVHDNSIPHPNAPDARRVLAVITNRRPAPRCWRQQTPDWPLDGRRSLRLLSQFTQRELQN